MLLPTFQQPHGFLQAFVGRLAAAEKALEEAPQPAEVTELHRSLSQARQHIQVSFAHATTPAAAPMCT